MNDFMSIASPAGYTTIKTVQEDTGVVTSMVAARNAIMYDLVQVVTRLLAGGSAYKAAALYFEYQNLDDPADTPDYPSFTKDESVDYYLGLQYSPNKDFVRVPLLSNPTASQVDSNTWRLSVHAITPNVSEGFWEKPFSAAANSVVIGGALVTTPIAGTQANDLILCRNYPSGAKVAKVSGEQISMTWNVEFTVPASSS